MTDETTETQETTPAQDAETTVDQPANEQPEQTEDPGTSEDSGEDSAADRPRKGVQKRIDELTSNWRNTERDRDYWRDLAMRQQMQQGQQSQQKTDQQPQQPAEKPQADKFDSYDDYLEALTDWKVEQREAQRQQQQQQQTTQQRQQEARKNFQSRAAQAKGKYEDFDAVAFNPALPVSEAMEQVLLESEKGPDVLYELGKNTAEAARIASLPPHMAALELGKIEARLSIPAPKKTTTAPDPIEPVGGRQGGTATDPDKMPVSDWMAWRNQQLHS